MNVKSKDKWKENALSYIKQEKNMRPFSFYELNRQLEGNSGILQELVAEGIM
jgi:hypothetical protein